jgi:hypothetical protein
MVQAKNGWDRLLEVVTGRRIVVLAGAGCSTESGIPDYRGTGTPRRAAPVQYLRFVRDASARARYWARSAIGWPRIRAARPNAGHQALARMEQAGRLKPTRSADMAFSRISAAMWRRHANPWSGWTRLLTTPLIYVPFWNRSWRQGLAVGAWFAVNPFLFPEPEDQQSWTARAIRGEAQWVKERPLDASLLIQAVGSAAAVGGLFAGYRRKLWPTVASAAAVMACNAWFLNRMAARARSPGKEP